MRLDVEALRTYLAVLDLGGMTAAAEQLSLSQSAISLRVRRLESHIGSDLLRRDGHAPEPTAIGAELIPYARTLVATHDDAIARLNSSALTGSVRLGAGQERLAEQLAPILGRFRHAHPNATITFRVGDGARVLERMLDAGDLDLVVTLVPAAEVRPDDHVLWRDDLAWIVGDRTIIDDDPIPLVTFNEGSMARQQAENALRAASQEYVIVFAGASIESVASALRAGIGVTLINRRSTPDGCTEWHRSSDAPPLDDVAHIARLPPTEPSPLALALATDIGDELSELEPASFEDAVEPG